MKGIIRFVVNVGVGLLVLGIVAGVLFGRGEDAPPTYIGNVVANITSLLNSLGANGLTGLLSLAVIYYLIYRFTRPGEPEETGKVESPDDTTPDE